jgi:hypothetical protein
LPAWAPSTHASHATVAKSGKASTCRKVSIHAPGFGKRRSHRGKSESSSTGSAMPTPSAANTASANPADWDTVKPTAAPMNGAVHGVATTVASTPESNASA